MKRITVYITSKDQECPVAGVLSGWLRVRGLSVVTRKSAVDQYGAWGNVPRFLFLADQMFVLLKPVKGDLLGMTLRDEIRSRHRLTSVPPIVFILPKDMELPHMFEESEATHTAMFVRYTGCLDGTGKEVSTLLNSSELQSLLDSLA